MNVSTLNACRQFPPAAREAMDRMDAIGDGWKAISDLLIPEPDLHVVNRDRLQRLLDILADDYREASERFTQAMHQR